MPGSTLGSVNTENTVPALQNPVHPTASSLKLRCRQPPFKIFVFKQIPNYTFLRSFWRLFILSASEDNIIRLKGGCLFTKLISWDPEQEKKTTRLTAHIFLDLSVVLPSVGRIWTGASLKPRYRRLSFIFVLVAPCATCRVHLSPH